MRTKVLEKSRKLGRQAQKPLEKKQQLWFHHTDRRAWTKVDLAQWGRNIWKKYRIFGSIGINVLGKQWLKRILHIYAAELKTGPIFAFLVLKTGPSFFVVLFLLISFSLQKEENFSKRTKINKNKRPVSSVKNWSNFVAQHTWTSF